jgi:hypothetical protein
MAAQPEMRTFERISHTARWNPKRFNQKRPDQERQYKSGYKPFKRICNFRCPVFPNIDFGTVFLPLTRRHK